MAIRRNSLINLAGSMAGLILFGALTPLYLNVVGAERYGILAIIWAFLAFFSAFDFGMGLALSYLIASDRTKSKADQANLFWTSLSISFPFGAVAGAVLFALIGGVFGNVFSLSPKVSVELLNSGPSLFAIGICTVLLSTVGGLFRGLQMFATTAAFGAAALALSILFPVIAALWISPSLHVLIQATLLSRLVIFFGALMLAHRFVLEGAAPRVSKAAARSLSGYGAWASLSGMIELAVSGADRFILGAISGTAAVTYYAVPSSVIARVLVIPNSLAGAALPQAASGSREDERLLARKILRMMGMLTPLFVFGMFTSHVFLSVWLGVEFAFLATTAMKILLLAYWLEIISLVLYFRVLGLGRPKVNVWAAALVLPPYIVALYFFITYWGVIGAALAYVLRNSIYLCARTTMTGSWRVLASTNGLAFLLLLLSLVVSLADLPGSLYSTVGVLFTLAAGVLAVRTRPAQVDHAVNDMLLITRRAVRKLRVRSINGD